MSHTTPRVRQFLVFLSIARRLFRRIQTGAPSWGFIHVELHKEGEVMVTSLPEAGSPASSQPVRRLSTATASLTTATRAPNARAVDKFIINVSALG